MGAGRITGIVLFAVILVSVLQVHAESVSVVVLDPNREVLAGARASVNCGHAIESLVPDNPGRFTLALGSGMRECEVRFECDGFLPFSASVKSATDPWIIELQMKKQQQEAITVVAAPEESSLKRTSLAGLTLVREDFEGRFENTLDLIRYAKLLAGTTFTNDAIYIDGFAGRSLPPVTTIAGITVNMDPFSAEYSHPNANIIEIATQQAPRRFSFHAGSGPLAILTDRPVGPNLRSESKSATFGIHGYLPSFPITFSFSGSVYKNLEDVGIQSVPPSNTSAQLSDFSTSGFLSAQFTTPSLFGSLSFLLSDGNRENAGAGGTVLPEAANSQHFGTKEFQMTFRRLWNSCFLRNNFSYTSTYNSENANTGGLGILVPGYFHSGGNFLSASERRSGRWFWKSVLEGSKSKGGFQISIEEGSSSQAGNPAGRMQFENLGDYLVALDGERSGTWLVQSEYGSAERRDVQLTAFSEREIWFGEEALLRLGLKLDYQSYAGLSISPRIFATARFRGVLFRAGVGRFVQNWSNSTLLQAMEKNAAQQFLVPNISFSDLPLNVDHQTRIVSRIDSNLTSQSDWMMKVSAERDFAVVHAGIEWTQTWSSHLLGSRRVRAADGWMDLLESNRSARKNNLALFLQTQWKFLSLGSQYQLISSWDNSAGPFSFQENDLDREWAQTSGVSRHNLTLTGTFQIPFLGVVSVIQTIRSPAPFDVTTGKDPAENGLQNSRDNFTRNCKSGPSFSSLDLYAMKTVPLPRTGIHVAIRIQVENALNQKNYIRFGDVAGSPFFDSPVDTYAGRTIRISFGFGS